MVEKQAIPTQKPVSAVSASPPPPPPAAPGSSGVVVVNEKRDWRSYVPTKVSTEYDSDGGVFVNKLSTSIWNGLVKLKTSFERGPDGTISYPLLGIVSKHLSVLYDHEDVNALVTVGGDFGRNLNAKYLFDVKAREGVLKLRANGFRNQYRAEYTSGSARGVSLGFPIGEVRVEEELREDEDTGEEFNALAVRGSVGGPVLGGLLVADYAQENFNLKYTYKDEEMTLSPCIQWPSKSLSVLLKRQFDSSNKFSFRYNFDSTSWVGVYKHKPMENFKIKMGYDSDVRLCWGSAWVGREDTGAKQAPRKCKLQLMVQVPQDDMRSAIVLFRVKKRWDL